MNDNEPEEKDSETEPYTLDAFELNVVSSAAMLKTDVQSDAEEPFIKKPDVFDEEGESKSTVSGAEIAEEVDPIFAELAAPKLPELPKENRARLQMQSPTRLNFYWTIKSNPYKTLSRALGGNTGNYTLIIKLVNLKTEREEFFPVEAEGSWWFDVDADAIYRAEIGFYAPNRPFVRVLFSNTVETPRRNPSPRRDATGGWTVSANQFAEVLNVSGFPQDAYEVALAGDDEEYADRATRGAFAQFTGKPTIGGAASDEIRFALLALASGYKLEHLREQIGASLFRLLEDSADVLSPENALASLQDNFGGFFEEIVGEEQTGAATFGASLINFPRTVKRRIYRRLPPKFSGISSFELSRWKR